MANENGNYLACVNGSVSNCLNRWLYGCISGTCTK